MNKNEGGYLSYLVRLWQVKGERGATWQASIENPATGEKLGFSSLEALFEYFEQHTGAKRDTVQSREGTHG